MKKLLTSNFFVLATMVLALVVLTNCNKDDDGDKPDGPPPTATLTTPVNAEPGKGISFAGTFNDELGLTGITLTNTDLGLAATISLDDEPLTYAMSYNFTIPETVQDGSYNVAVVASNTSQKTAEFTIAVVVESPVEIPDNYDAVWVAGGVLWWEWGTPEGYFYEMIKDEENPGWFEVDLQSWAGFNEIKFLGQNAWAPDNWGLVDNTDPNSDMVNDENSATVVLPDMDKNPAYYRVRFNPNTLEYNYEELIPDMEVHDKMYIVGSGFTDYPNLDWNPEEAIEMTHNPYEYGVYQFTAEGVMFSDDVAMKFIGQNDGWGPIDMGFAGESREVTAPQNWVVLVEGDGTADLKFKDQAGTYTIYLDYFLKRAVIWPE